MSITHDDIEKKLNQSPKDANPYVVQASKEMGNFNLVLVKMYDGSYVVWDYYHEPNKVINGVYFKTLQEASKEFVRRS